MTCATVRNYDIRNPTQARKEPTPAPAARERAVIAQVAEKITDGDVDAVIEMLREGIGAKVSMRAARSGGDRNNYVMAPDWPARLAAGKLLLAYKAGNPVDTVTMLNLGNRGNESATPLTREEMIDQLQSTGTDLKNIVDVWLQGMKTAEKAEPGAPILEIPQPTGPVEVVEV